MLQSQVTEVHVRTTHNYEEQCVCVCAQSVCVWYMSQVHLHIRLCIGYQPIWTLLKPGGP